MRFKAARRLLFILPLSLTAIPALANGHRFAGNHKTLFFHITFQSPTIQPFAYTHFCLRYATDCLAEKNAFDRVKPIELTSEKRTELEAINSEVNGSIVPQSMEGDKSFATWRIAPAYGNCNDYAVTKRHQLLARGWPFGALLLAEVITPEHVHHLVLVVRTRQHDYVLDNLATRIRYWEDTPYEWVRIQSPHDAVLWSTIKQPQA